MKKLIIPILCIASSLFFLVTTIMNVQRSLYLPALLSIGLALFFGYFGITSFFKS